MNKQQCYRASAKCIKQQVLYYVSMYTHAWAWCST